MTHDSYVSAASVFLTLDFALPSSTLRTLDAKLREHIDSSELMSTGDKFTNMSVFESPESDSERRNVRVELRNGTCFAFSIRAWITSPRADNDLLIARASFRRSPAAFVRERRSDLRAEDGGVARVRAQSSKRWLRQ